MNKYKGNENVIYDDRIPRIREQKKQKRNKTFIFFILLFFFLVLIVLYIQSPISKLQEIHVTGNVLLEKEQVIQIGGLQLGMSYFNLNSSQIKARLEERVEIQRAEVKRIFPNQLDIQMTEHEIVAYWYEEQQLYPVLSSGHILYHRSWEGQRVTFPILTGWTTKEGVLELSTELSKLPNPILRKISEIRLTPIVSDPYRLTLYMEDGNEVRISIRKFAENMSWYPHMIEKREALGEKTEGIYHLLDGMWYEDPSQSISQEDEEN